ncbi:uncharacterized CRM domain-containing protein At3g25440, chloroplastic-like isoform X2 [Cornus florida]|uniref:uncharacterized CRM domain-containing protein At3g25440, chloroplastic-like isoform X2 n=1 Tax=Cornus florida TaxID=4283 RepID=UPI002896DB89|nr:uncharacterized CRM domain-containing protein At3g25440, chloroplastic-like isoform X2 [Cornus florida]
MVTRVFASVALGKTQQLRNLLFCPLIFTPTAHKFLLHKPSVVDVICKVCSQDPSASGPLYGLQRFSISGKWIHSGRLLNEIDQVVEQAGHTGSSTDANGACDVKPKRKKLKGKRAVVRWIKFFRWKKKKEYERMTTEEKYLYKLRKARKKEERLVDSLKKIEPKDSSETTHDPEILTPEEHFYFLKMGIKSKNYVPVGRRGIYQGVILNMHLHWKKHQTLKVVVKTFSPEEVKEIAAELARLSGGIVLDIQEDDTIIMYRGKNYSQPPTEIMSPRITLPRKKALDKSKYRDGLRAVRKYIPRLEQELELLQAKAASKVENKSKAVEETPLTDIDSANCGGNINPQLEDSDKLREIMDRNDECPEEDDSLMDSDMGSDSEALSDIFETDSETDTEEVEHPLYLNEFEKFPLQTNAKPHDFEEHLRQISADSKKAKSLEKDAELPDLDEVDRMFLQAASLLKKKRK